MTIRRRWLLTAAAAALLLAPRDISATTDICYEGGPTLPGFQLNGSATLNGTAVLVTPNLTQQNGTIMYTSQLSSAGDLHIEMEIEITTTTAPGADGMAFIMHQDPRGPSALGEPGEGMAYGYSDAFQDAGSPITPSVVVEFDTYFNYDTCDPNANHIAIMQNGVPQHPTPPNTDAGCGAGAPDGGVGYYPGYDGGMYVNYDGGAYHPGYYYTPPFNMGTVGTSFYVWVDYTAANTLLSVYISQTSTKPAYAQLETSSINLATKFGGNPFWMGFSGSTGASFQTHEVLSFIASDTVLTSNVCCTSDSTCIDGGSALGNVCDPSKNVCGQCSPTETGYCPAGLTGCNTTGGTDVCANPCSGNYGTDAGPYICGSPYAPVCVQQGSGAGSCIACNGSYGSTSTYPCPVGAPTCAASTGYCLFCTSSSNCNGQACETASAEDGGTGTAGLCAPCTGNQGTTGTAPCDSADPYCNSGLCYPNCQKDTDCGAGKWCAGVGDTSSCQPIGANGTPLPTGVTCSPSIGQRGCTSTVCDPNDNECGLEEGDGTCTSTAECQAGYCDLTADAGNYGKCEACISDTNCSGTTPACNTTTNKCVQCTSTNLTQCGASDPVCTNNLCEPCNGDYGTSATNACLSAKPYCNTSAGTCNTVCQVDTDCGAGKWCAGAVSGAPANGCVAIAANGVALPTGVTCSTSIGARACLTGACDSTDGKNECGIAEFDPYCTTAAQCRAGDCVTASVGYTHYCEPCATNTDCSSPKPYCDTTQDVCAQCTTDSECSTSTPVCTSDACVICNGDSSSITATSPCPASAPYCNMVAGAAALGTCNTICQQDADCGTGNWCAGAVVGGNGCVAQVANGTKLPTGVTCSATIGPRACLSGACDSTDGLNECGVAEGDGTCTATAECRAGQCVTTAGSANLDKCEPCVTTANCTGGQQCNTTTNQCVQCLTDAQCAGTAPICSSSDTCVACNGNSGSLATEPCPASAPYCDTLSGAGLGSCNTVCQQDSDCGAGNWCAGAVSGAPANGCVAKAANGVALPTGVTCSSTIGPRACLSGACDSTDGKNECGVAEGDGTCTTTAECRAGQCVTTAGSANLDKCEPCLTTANCTGGQQCNTTTNQCVQCLTDTQCSGLTPVCTSGDTCVACNGDSGSSATEPCPASAPYCDTLGDGNGGSCNTVCQQDSDCGSGNWCAGAVSGAPANGCVAIAANGVALPTGVTCSPAIATRACLSHACDGTDGKNECGIAEGDGTCTSTLQCRAGQCVTTAGSANLDKCEPCLTSSNCTGGQVCNTASNQCVQCLTDSQCSGTAPVCSASDSCVACNGNNGSSATEPCPAGAPYCDTLGGANNGSCNVLCQQDSDCGAGNWCAGAAAGGNGCSPKVPNGTLLPYSLTCSPSLGARACVTGACDLSDNGCGIAEFDGTCSPSAPQSQCRAGYCVAAGPNLDKCEPCVNSSECAGGLVCDLTLNQCVQCLTDAQCAGQTPVCSSDTCVACNGDNSSINGSTASLPCPGSAPYCDLTGDASSGSCSTVCQQDSDCGAGNWCAGAVAGGNGCVAQLPNGTLLPYSLTCSPSLGARACITGACDLTDNECGIAEGDGTCNPSAILTQCRAGLCVTSGANADKCEPCLSDGDCGSPAVCDTTTNQCVQCTAQESSACVGQTPVCTSDTCVACAGDEGAGSGSDCPAAAPFCDTLLDANAGTCNVVCQQDSDCGQGNWCSGIGNAASPNGCFPLEPNGTLIPDGLVCTQSLGARACLTGACDTNDNTCGIAEFDGTCDPSAPQTQCRAGLCVPSGVNKDKCEPCLTSSDCHGGPVCDSTTNQCVQCTAGSTGNCAGSTPVCSNDACVACTGNSGTGGNACPAAAPYCNAGNGTCNAVCVQDSDCGAGNWCAGAAAGGNGCLAQGANGTPLPLMLTCSPALGLRACLTGVCDLNDNACGIALGDPTCASTPQCRAGVCITDPGSPFANHCESCGSDSDCASSPLTAVCDPSVDQCVQCTSAEAGACTGQSPICVSDACEPCTGDYGSTATITCPSSAPFCDTLGDASAGSCNTICVQDTDCGLGFWCAGASAGGNGCEAQVPNGGTPPGGTCPPPDPQACASGVCDPNNNQCGYGPGDGPCTTNSQCQSGICVLVEGNPDYGDCEPCDTDSNCSGTPTTPACNTTTDQCVQCTVSNTTACPTTAPICDSNVCKPCNGNFNSGASDACLQPAPYCNIVTGACFPTCQQNSDCPSGDYCSGTGATSSCQPEVPNGGTPPGGCTPNDPQCQSGVCDPMDGNCGSPTGGPCTNTSQCRTGVCVTSGGNAGTCQQCATDLNCAGTPSTPVCDPTINVCVQCDSQETSQCGPNAPLCVGDICVACNGNYGSGATDACLAANPYCNLQNGSCNATCQQDTDCPMGDWCSFADGSSSCEPQVPNGGPAPGGCPLPDPNACVSGVCDPSNNECGIAPGDPCTSTSQCQSGVCVPPGLPLAGTCEPCIGDSDCSTTPSTPACDTSTDQCVPCTATNTSACTGGTPVCTSDTCVPCTGDSGATTASACPAANPYCNTAAGTCNSNCQQDSDCPGGWCDNLSGTSSCQPLVPNGQPVPGGTCTPTLGARACLTGACDLNSNDCGINLGDQLCTTQAQCDTGVCLPNGFCEPCAVDSDCAGTPSTPACDTTTNQCVQCTASNSTSCTGTTPICASDSCVGCGGDNGSGAVNACPTSANPYCDPNGTCRECTSNTDCTNGTHAGPICDPGTGSCGVACTTDPDCISTDWCDDPTGEPGGGTCVEKTPNGQPLPSPNPIDGTCTTANGQRACLSGVCDTGDNLCGEPNSRDCTSAAQCRSAVCEANGTCGEFNGEACTSAAQCRSGVCSADGLCGEPNGDGCEDARVCRSSICAADGLCGQHNGDGCTAPAACRSGLCAPDGKCGDATGSACTSGNDCRSLICEGATCVLTCTADGSCSTGNYCSSGSCVPVVANGQACTDSSDCVSGICANDALCGTPVGSPCTAPAECRSGLCDVVGGTCSPACSIDADCSAGSWCSTGSCVPTLANAQPCTDPASCTSGMCNLDGACGQPNLSPCAESPDCRSGICDDTGTCVGACNEQSDCDEGTYCNLGVCAPSAANGTKPGGAVCTSGVECLSGICDADGACGARSGETCGQTLECRSGICDESDGRCGYADGDGPCNAADAATVCRSGVCDTDGKCGLLNGDSSCTSLNAASVCRSGVCDPDGSCGYANGDGSCNTGNAGVVCRSGVCGSDGKCGLADGDGTCTTANASTVCRVGVCGADGKCGLPNGQGTCTPGSTAICRSGVCDLDGKCGLANGDPGCSSTTAAAVCRSGVCDTDGSCGLAAGDGTCTAGSQCRSGVCVPSGTNGGRCEPCVGDSDCNGTPATPVCDTATNTCVQCAAGDSAACQDGTPICLSDACVACTADFGTPSSQACPSSAPFCNLTNGSCNTTCQQDSECGAGQWCDAAGGTPTCQPLVPNGQAVPGGLCTPAIGARVCLSGACDVKDNLCGVAEGDATCTVDAQCRAGVCITGTTAANAGKCEPCQTDANCSTTPATPACDATSNQCVQCSTTNAVSCSGATPVCTADACVACTANAGAASGNACPMTAPYCNPMSGACSASCQKDSDCLAGNWCEAIGNVSACVPLLPNGALLPSACTMTLGARACLTGVCDLNDNKCGVAEGDGTCSSSTQCRAGVCLTGVTGANANKCEPCGQDSDCAGSPATPACDTTTNACVQCTTANTLACTGTTPICMGEQCVPCNGNFGSTATRACPMADPFCNGTTGACNDTCVTDSDCPSGEWCEASGGVSTCQPLLANGTMLPGGVCSPELGGRACISGVCDSDGACGLETGDGVCNAANGAAVCRDGVCGADGKCGLPTGDGTCTAADAATVCRDGVCDTDGKCGLADGDGTCIAADAATVCRSGVCDTDGKCGYGNGDGPCTAADAASVCRSGVCDTDGKCGLANGDGTCSAADAAEICRSGVCDTDGKCGLANGDGTCTATDGAVICRDGVCDSDGKCGLKNGDGLCTVDDEAAICRSSVCDTDKKCGLAVGDGPCTAADGAAVCRSGLCGPAGTCVLGGAAKYTGGGVSCSCASGSTSADALLLMAALWFAGLRRRRLTRRDARR